jgi:hypothetical protein
LIDTIVLIIGSAPDAVRAARWDKVHFNHVVAINNAWKIRNDWDFLIHPEDFPKEKQPPSYQSNQKIITAHNYVPIQNQYGGFVYAGGTMAFTAAYWALGQLKPSAILFIGCDMIYPNTHNAENQEDSHFYGAGTADPLRQDDSLQSLEAKSARFLYFAYQQDCAVFNLSLLPASKLIFPRLAFSNAHSLLEKIQHQTKSEHVAFNPATVDLALALEQSLGYYFASGRYWEHADIISASSCREVDALWLKSLALKI